MRRIFFTLPLSCLVILFLHPGCLSDRSGDEFALNLVEFPDVAAVFNLSRTHLLFGSYADTSGKSTIMAANGDLLFLMLEDESLFLRYNAGDRNSIAIVMDTMCTKRFYNHGDLVALHLSEDPLLFEWLDSVDGKTFSHLRALQISLPLPEPYRPLLQKITEESAGAGLVLECDGNITESDVQMLEALSPHWIYLTDCQLSVNYPGVVPLFHDVELLGIEGEDIQWALDSDLFPNLISLILKGWNPLRNGNYTLPNAEFLQSITLVEPFITDLSFLEQVPGLSSLHVVSCDTLSDIGFIHEIGSMNSIGFPLCRRIKDIQAMHHLRSLRWVSYPTSAGPEELSRISSYFPDLQVLEIIGCESIRDLSAIASLDSLQCLIVDLPEMDLSVISTLSKLRLLVIEEEKFEESNDEILKIREALPDLQVLPGGGLCMGSGWILLLFPMLLITWLFYHRVRWDRLKKGR